MAKANRLVTGGQYQAALDLLNSAGRSPQVLNLRGVCLLRMNRYAEAIQLYRSLVLNADSICAARRASDL